jgi:hypothetical protein
MSPAFQDLRPHIEKPSGSFPRFASTASFLAAASPTPLRPDPATLIHPHGLSGGECFKIANASRLALGRYLSPIEIH